MSPRNPAAEDHVRAARAKAAYLRSYFAHALYALIPIQSDRVPTMSIDKWGRLYYNPTFVLACDVDEIATVCLHEIGHKLRHHHDRAAALGVTEATHMIANISQDLELNDDIADEVRDLKDIKALPGGAVYPSTFGFEDGQVWEVYYARLMDELEKHADKMGDGEGGEGGDGDGDGQAKGRRGKKPGGANDPARKRKHKCGSGATGVPQPWEDQAPANGGGEGIEDADWKDIERRVANAIREEHSKGRGTVPGTWVSWADDMLRIETIPWDQELQGAVRWAVNDVSGKVIHNYRRPSRRQQACPDVAFPSMRRPIPNVAFVGDTSGSMSEDALAIVRTVVQDVCQALGACLSFIATDADAHGVQRAHDGRSIEMRGRGGTNMCVGIESAMEDVKPRPDVIIVATDCETPWPDEEPSTRVIICAIEANEHSVEHCPDWARVITVKLDGEG
jgi:predicted metal-dependent peptidase